jgi:DNA-directed RNA polymerase subunit K/omega
MSSKKVKFITSEEKKSLDTTENPEVSGEDNDEQIDDWNEEDDVDDIDDDDDDDDDDGDDEMDIILDDNLGDGNPDEIEGDERMCIYNNVGRKRGNGKLITNTEREEVDEDYGKEIDDSEEYIYVPEDERITSNRLTKYEVSHILEERTVQIAGGAKHMMIEQGIEKMKPKKIAQLELEALKSPFIIRRTRPDGKKELFKISEMILDKKYILYGFNKQN